MFSSSGEKKKLPTTKKKRLKNQKVFVVTATDISLYNIKGEPTLYSDYYPGEQNKRFADYLFRPHRDER